MKDVRVNAIAENKSERVAKCANRQAIVSQMDGALRNSCIDCGSSFWIHPVYGRSTRCCACRASRQEKQQHSRTDSYLPKEGFPKADQFTEMEELHRYFSHTKLTCLECGHEFRGLQQHINHMHLMSANDYKRKFGIPLGFGLVGCETKAALAVFMTDVNAELTKDELDARILTMHEANPCTGGIVSTQPVIKKKRIAVAKAMLESPLHVSKTVAGKTQAPCNECGAMFEVAAWSSVTNPCRIKCKSCNAKAHNAYKKVWRSKNPDSVKQYGQTYRERLNENGLLQEFDRKKHAAKKAKAAGELQ